MSYFLTQILLTPEIIVKERITDTYSIHRLVYDQFERDCNESATTRKSPLWTVSTSGVFNKIIILSSIEPRKNVVSYINCKRSVITYPENILFNKKFIFKITANPTMKKEGKVVPIRDVKKVKAWLVRQGEKCGFIADSIIVSKLYADIFTYKKGYKVTINKADISGELRVQNLDKFKSAVFNGIGREKSFGCGLLQVIPKE